MIYDYLFNFIKQLIHMNDNIQEKILKDNGNDPTIKRVKNFIFSSNDIIGKGYSSIVYKGVRQGGTEEVAIKVVDLSKIKNQIQQFLLNNEMKALRKLNHPNIIKCYDILVTKNNVYIITEYCKQGDLLSQLKTKGRFSQPQILTIIIDVLQGYLHIQENKIIHRDLKTANIFMCNKRAKIADFGFCYIINDPQPTVRYNVGSPAYMCQQSYLQNIYSSKTDVWSIGIIIYELLVGITPFKTSQYGEMIRNLTTGNYGFPSNILVSEGMRLILSFCFKEKLNERIDPRILLQVVNVQLAKMNVSKPGGRQGRIISTPIQPARNRSKSKDKYSAFSPKLPLQPKKQQYLALKSASDYIIFLYRIAKILDEDNLITLFPQLVVTLKSIIIKNHSFVINETSFLIKSCQQKVVAQFEHVNMRLLQLPLMQQKHQIQDNRLNILITTYPFRNDRALSAYLYCLKEMLEQIQENIQIEVKKINQQLWILFDYLLLYYELVELHISKLTLTQIVRQSNIATTLKHKSQIVTQNHIKLLKLKKKIVINNN